MPKLIIAILPKGKIKKVMPIIKKTGIFGATELSGKGLCGKDGMLPMGKMGAAREILVLATLDVNVKKLIHLLDEHGKIKKPGGGVIFVVDVCQIIG